MLFKIFVSFLIKLLYDLPLMILGLFIIPVGLLFEKNNHLPTLCWLWDNDKYGCNGGDFWKRTRGENTSFISKFIWLALRNPTYNSSRYVLGTTSSGIISFYGNERVSRNTEEGWYWAEDGWKWEFHYIKAYNNKTKCIKFRAGWKIMNKMKGDVCSFVFSPNPFVKYSGK